MLREQRLQMIVELIKKKGAVQSSALSELLGVTGMTVRRDLDYLAESGTIIRTHGGAIASTEGLPAEPSYDNRIDEQISAKEQIAKTALTLIEAGQRCYFDSGTTTLRLAGLLNNDMNNVFITNGLNIALALRNNSRGSVIIIGGEFDGNTLSTRGAMTERQISEFSVDIAFMGCNAVSWRGEVMVGNITETGVKRQVMSISCKKYLLATSDKFDSSSLVSYASTGDFDGIITDSALSPDKQEAVRLSGTGLFLAGSGEVK